MGSPSDAGNGLLRPQHSEYTAASDEGVRSGGGKEQFKSCADKNHDDASDRIKVSADVTGLHVHGRRAPEGVGPVALGLGGRKAVGDRGSTGVAGLDMRNNARRAGINDTVI